MQGWISLGRDRVWQLDVYATALNTIEARFADGSMSTEGILEQFRAQGTDLNEKYLHLLEGGYLWAGLDQGSRYYAELPDGVPPGLVVEAPAELSDSALRDRMGDLADDIDARAGDDPDSSTGTRTFTAWVRQVLDLSDERGQAGLFAESRALLACELQDAYRDPAAKLDPGGVIAVCDGLDNRARGLHAARLMNGRTAGAMLGIAALTRAVVSADDTRPDLAGRLLTVVAVQPPGSDPAACLAALVADHLRDGPADTLESLADGCRRAGLAWLNEALDSTDPSGDEFVEGLHRAALEFQTCFLLARSVLEAPAGEGRPETGEGGPETGEGGPETGEGGPETGEGGPETGEGWPEMLDIAEEYGGRIMAALLDMARDTGGEQTQVLMWQTGRMRRDRGETAACEYVRSLVEAEFRYPRTALTWLTEAAEGRPHLGDEPAPDDELADA